MESTALRSHTCGQLRIQHNNTHVQLCGWVQARRDHGGIIFVDLRDRHGLTQIVFDPNTTQPESFQTASQLRREDCIRIIGTVRPRGEGLENPKLATGKIEIISTQVQILSKSQTPPFEIDDNQPINDELRLEYRYLDLRRAKMQFNLAMRGQAALAVRKYLTDNEGFIEYETPFLIRSTPEGARDYVVPSRVNPGKFYALPQSPQIYKQLLMVSGCDRYFQFAKCFRDEDLRADRQPEFTQIDLEMSFVSQEDVFRIVEGIIKSITDQFGVNVKIPFRRFTYKQAMDAYSSDKPDLRFDLFTKDITPIVAKSDFSVFKNVVESGGIVKCINPDKQIPRSDIDKYIEYAQSCGAKGMAWMRVEGGKLESNIAKYFSQPVQQELIRALDAKDGSTIMCIAGVKEQVNDVISRLRLKVADDLGMIDKTRFEFAWIVDFPLFEKNAESPTGWSPAHHMFVMPKQESIPLIKTAPEQCFADCYDVVLNGVELGSGSIRCHLPDLQREIMEVVGFPPTVAEEKFGYLVRSFKYGAPPHGGLAIGFDRIIALLCGTSDIREVITFPKNKNAQSPLDGSPGTITDEQLKELSLKVDIPKKN